MQFCGTVQYLKMPNKWGVNHNCFPGSHIIGYFHPYSQVSRYSISPNLPNAILMCSWVRRRDTHAFTLWWLWRSFHFQSSVGSPVPRSLISRVLTLRWLAVKVPPTMTSSEVNSPWEQFAHISFPGYPRSGHTHTQRSLPFINWPSLTDTVLLTAR